jgi:uncharacterized protein (TIGR03435 family)
MAWELKAFELSAPRLAGNTVGYDIEAKMPPSTTKKDFHLMLQHLLIERLALVVHQELRERTVFELVLAKGGPKLHTAEVSSEGAVAPDTPSPANKPMTVRDKDGKLQLPPGQPRVLLVRTGSGFRLMARMQRIEEIARTLEDQVGHRVVDKTGLNGIYDYTLDFTNGVDDSLNGLPAPAEAEPFIAPAIVRQLGLKLETRKQQPVSVLVVDHFDRIPSDN